MKAPLRKSVVDETVVEGQLGITYIYSNVHACVFSQGALHVHVCYTDKASTGRTAPQALCPPHQASLPAPGNDG